MSTYEHGFHTEILNIKPIDTFFFYFFFVSSSLFRIRGECICIGYGSMRSRVYGQYICTCSGSSCTDLSAANVDSIWLCVSVWHSLANWYCWTVLTLCVAVHSDSVGVVILGIDRRALSDGPLLLSCCCCRTFPSQLLFHVSQCVCGCRPMSLLTKWYYIYGGIVCTNRTTHAARLSIVYSRARISRRLWISVCARVYFMHTQRTHTHAHNDRCVFILLLPPPKRMNARYLWLLIHIFSAVDVVVFWSLIMP